VDVRHVNPFIEAFSNIMPILGFAEISKGSLSKKEKILFQPG
jgi:chemotaxis protein CheX